MLFIFVIDGSWHLKSTDKDNNLEELSKKVDIKIYPYSFVPILGLFFRLNGQLLPQAFMTSQGNLQVISLLEGVQDPFEIVSSKELTEKIGLYLIESGDIKAR